MRLACLLFVATFALAGAGCAKADDVTDPTVEEEDAATSEDAGNDAAPDAPPGDATVADSSVDSASTTDTRAEASTDSGAKTDADAAILDTTATDTRDASTDIAPTDAGPCHVVINELQVGTAASGTNEFVEIYNPCATISLDGWKLVYRGGNVTADTVLHNFASSAMLASGGYFVAGGNNFSPKDAQFGTGGLNPDGGAVGLLDELGNVVDAVRYGDSTNSLREGSAAPTPGESSPVSSIARLPNGQDTNDNSVDFAKVTPPTPKAANN